MQTESLGKIANRHFVSIPFRDGELLDLSNDIHPTRAYGWGHQGNSVSLDSGATYYCFVVAGPAKLTVFWPIDPYSIMLREQMYFAAPTPITIEGGCGIVVARLNCRGMLAIGGPIEERGRLRYIDGCTDSLLIPPVVRGDPCLNHLHFPKHISQTRHTHPSIRIGIVVRGMGRCVVPDESRPEFDITIPLQPGHLFWIPTNGQHSFFTDDSEMDVIAYHPDSDTGPDDDDHPMVNRTIVEGISAARIDQIRTR